MTKLIDRAPDNQPTENILYMLKNEQAQLDAWTHQREADLRSIERSAGIIERKRKSVEELEAQLAIRLQEEQEAVEVNGL